MAYEGFLAKVPIFAHCSDDEIASISDLARESSFAPGQIIVTQGTPGQAFYMVLSGRVEVRRDGVPLGQLSSGEFFGEMSLLDQAPRSATISATENTVCLMLSSWDFRALIERSPSIALKLLEVMSGRLRAADERLGR